MKLVLLTPIYAASTSINGQGATPVVHYFTREWVKMGHEVVVFHFEARYPRPLYWFSRCFQHKLNTKLGMLVPVNYPSDEDYEADGVRVHKRCLNKIIPHSRYAKKQLDYALDCVKQECESFGIPDWFLGHWDNPQLELLNSLKHCYGKPVSLVLHGNVFNFEKKYGRDGLGLISNLDAVGFRSKVAQINFENKYGKLNNSFIASSGVSQKFLSEGSKTEKILNHPVKNFVFVGSLIARKFPSVIVTAVAKVFHDEEFILTFIGNGAEKERIEEEYKKSKCKGKIIFTGRINRGEIIEHLKQSDVSVMISKEEVFGLVYLEAMALGLIPIGSKNEGIDGIICNGVNGFLCKAGDEEELEVILEKIKNMNREQLSNISMLAQKTALEYSDSGVAKKYIDSLIHI